MSERPESVQKVIKWLAFGMGVKAFMLEEGLRQHSESCPFCEQGKVAAVLAGRKNHLVLSCNTDGCVRMRE